MSRALPLLPLLLCASASAQLRADIARDTSPGQATMRVMKGEQLLFQATTQGLNAVTESKFSADGRWLLNIAGGSGYVQLWDVTKGERVRTFLAPQPQYRRNFAEFTPGRGRLLLSFLGEGTTLGRATPGSFITPLGESSLWDLATLKRLSVVAKPERQSFYDGQVAFSTDGERMVFFGGGGPASVRDAKTGAYITTIPRLPYPQGAPQLGGAGAEEARLSPDGRRALVRYVDGRMAEYDAATGKLLRVRGTFDGPGAQAQLERFAAEGP